jgi:hypothetical protein
VGGGSIDNPAVAPPPAYGIGGTGFVPVKNWHFGAGGTIKNIADMNGEFVYHDQFNTIGNGPNYGALMMAPDEANAVPNQPVEDAKHPVRQFLSDSLRTYLVPLNGATTVKASERNVGCGSFMAKWKLPHGGSLLNQDILWETRVRYVTPPYFWTAIWACGNKWSRGAEVDVMESFGYDNGGGITNYDGRYWHSNSVGGTDTLKYASWGRDMAARGFGTFDATQYHTWSWLYRRDNTYSVYLDGIEVQSGAINWTLRAKAAGEPLEMYFLFDGAWGHTGISSVNKPLPATELDGKYYEWNYSRVYLRNPAPGAPPVGPVPDPVQPAQVVPVAANNAPPVAEKDLLRLAERTDLAGVVSNKATFSLTDDAGKKALRIECQPGAGYPGIGFPSQTAPLDLSAFDGVEATLTNTGATDAAAAVRVDNEGDWQKQPWNAENITIPPGKTVTVRVLFGKSYGQKGYPLDPSKVSGIRVFVCSPKSPVTLTLNSLRAVKTGAG